MKFDAIAKNAVAIVVVIAIGSKGIGNVNCAFAINDCDENANRKARQLLALK